MKKLVLVLLLLPTLLAAQNNNVQKFINKTLQKDSLFQNSLTGILVMDDTDKVVAQWNADIPMMTASTMKTITTGAALQILGPDYRYKTTLAYTGEIQDSILNGNLIIIGEGDPTFGSRDTIATPIEEIFGRWADAVKALGIKEVKGYIVGDDTYFTHEIIPGTWSWYNLGEYYGSGTSGLNYCENVQYFTIKPGAQVGDKVEITNIEPFIPEMQYHNECLTGEPDSGNNTLYIVSDLAKTSINAGTLEIDRDSLVADFSNKFPDVTCAWAFKEFLKGAGVVCNDTIPEYEDLQVSECSVKTIAENYSCPLIDIVYVTNKISNNFFAETMLKTIAKKVKGVGSYDSAYVAMEEFIRGKGLSTTGYDQLDGSGLARRNNVTPRFFCKFYKMMEEYEGFEEYVATFPVPGMPGTAKYVLRNEPLSFKSRIHAKSGTLSGVRAYAGYVDGATVKNKYRFAILVNNFPVSTSKMQPNVEAFLNELAIYAEKH